MKNNIENNQPIKIKNLKVKKKINVFMVLFFCLLPITLVALTFNVWSCVNISNKSCNISVSLCDNANTAIGESLLIGENYVCSIDLNNSNKSYIDKYAEVKIVIRNANIMKEVGFFNNVNFEQFEYYSSTNTVEATVLAGVKHLSSEKLNISFNFCPNGMGIGDLSIQVFVNDSLVECYSSPVVIF